MFASDIYRGVVQVCSDRNGLAGEALLRILFEGIASAIILAKHRAWLKDFVRHGRFTELWMMRVIEVDSLEARLAPQIAATEAEFQPGMYDKYYQAPRRSRTGNRT